MNKLPYGLKELGLKEKDIFFDDNLSDEFANDSRQESWKKQRVELGFDARELWDLDLTMAIYIYPRIKYFRDHYAEMWYSGKLNNNEEWLNILDKILLAFKIIIMSYKIDDIEYDYKKIEEGLILFAKHFNDFWW